MGLLGVTVPEKWGGLGLGYLHHTIAMEGESLKRIWKGVVLTSSELTRASASVALSYGVRSVIEKGRKSSLDEFRHIQISWSTNLHDGEVSDISGVSLHETPHQDALWRNKAWTDN